MPESKINVGIDLGKMWKEKRERDLGKKLLGGLEGVLPADEIAALKESGATREDIYGVLKNKETMSEINYKDAMAKYMNQEPSAPNIPSPQEVGTLEPSVPEQSQAPRQPRPYIKQLGPSGPTIEFPEPPDVAKVNLERKMEEKKALQEIDVTADQRNAIMATENSLKLLEEVESMLNEKDEKGGYKYKTGGTIPSYRYGNLPLGMSEYIMAQKGKPGEAKLKAKLRKLQAEFIKAQTGAQRGFKEMSFLLPALPQIEFQDPTQALEVIKSAKDDMKSYLGQMKKGKGVSKPKITPEQARAELERRRKSKGE